MRAVTLALAGGLTLAASAQAAPLPPTPAAIELGAAPPFELVRDGCGRGWHRTHWRDQWGNWQWGDCIPKRGSPRRLERGLVLSLPKLAGSAALEGLGVPIEVKGASFLARRRS